MNLILQDDIIFSIQKWGGISNYWAELKKGIIKDNSLELLELEIGRKNISNLYSGSLIKSIGNDTINFREIERYQNPKPRIDVDHIFHSSYYRYSKNKRSTNITTAHDFSYETHSKGLKKSIHVWQKSRALKESNAIIVVSEYTKHKMLEFYPHLRNKRIEVIYCGIDHEMLIQDSSKKSSLALPFDSNGYALFVGDRKALYKNFGLACSAIKRSRLPFLIIGGGELTHEEISLLGGVDYKHVLFASNEDLSIYYAHALLLLYPSESEGFGIPIIEAQALGCPVITSNKSCIPEVAGEGAFFVENMTEKELAKSLVYLSQTESVRKELIEAGHKNSKKYSWDNTRNRTIQLYKDL